MPDESENIAPPGFTIICDVRFQPGPRGRKKVVGGAQCAVKMEKGKLINSSEACRSPPLAHGFPGRVPRLARLMALAIHFDGLIKSGLVRDYADIARLGGISRARMTQIMNLLLLAPPLQEKILFLPQLRRGKDTITEHHVREVVKTASWEAQKQRWHSLELAASAANSFADGGE